MVSVPWQVSSWCSSNPSDLPGHRKLDSVTGQDLMASETTSAGLFGRKPLYGTQVILGLFV